MRPHEYFKSEIDYLNDYVPRTFGTPIDKDSLTLQLSEMIKEKVENYIYQRFRDWTGPELARLILELNKEPEKVEEVREEPKRRGRPAKV